MQSDGQYVAKLEQTTAAIKAWTGFVADVARVEEGQLADRWRLGLVPRAAGACAIDIALRADRRCDLTLDGEVYEDCGLDSLDMVLPLIEAVVEGRVIRRRRMSTATGLLLEVSTVVAIADGTVKAWRRGARADNTDDTVAIVVCDRHYVPYRRG